jgi:hypothetical protein
MSSKQSGTAMFIEMTGNETEDQCKQIAFEMFCSAHPVEAHQKDPDGFWLYFQKAVPTISREKMLTLLEECEEQT